MNDDEELANEIIARLNTLIEDPAIRKDIGRLIEKRIPAGELSTKTRSHVTIQVTDEGFGFLGLLNGLVGAMPDGPRKGWGFISAEFDDEGLLVCFNRTSIGRCKKCGEDDPERINGRCQGVKGSSHDWKAVK